MDENGQVSIQWESLAIIDRKSRIVPSDVISDTLLSTLISDSETRMDDLALHDDFPEQDRSWDDSGTIISDT